MLCTTRRWVPIVLATLTLAGGGAEARETQVYFGDTHVHSNLSLDAAMVGEGVDSFGPEEAYRFALGEEIPLRNGLTARLERPLDFLVVSDHAEYLGVAKRVVAGDPQILDTWRGKLWYWITRVPGWLKVLAIWRVGSTAFQGREWLDAELAQGIVKTTWQHQSELADAYNRPGTFTALIGFEWSSAPGYNLHRNVVFRDGAERTTQVMPFSALDSLDPEDLWQYMEAYERETGGRVLAIPHNSNLSQGNFFGTETQAGVPIGADYARVRAHWEPVVEVTQTKGDSETHPSLSPDDPFADFERWDIGMTDPEAFRDSYARSSLGVGLEIEARTGANPYVFGMIGSTDAHTAFGNAEEDYFWGISLRSLPGEPERTMEGFLPLPGIPIKNAHAGASGYAAIWAEANTREALFDAMRRKEVYATTGSRMRLRFFGGWGYATEDADSPALAAKGYAGGVPMGGTLPIHDKSGGAPRFLVAAMKDPVGANLDRMQIVKGWLDAEGRSRERIFDVAVSGDRPIPGRGLAEPIGNTVDVEAGTYTNAIGSAELRAVWRDPEFDPSRPAFYYVRALEIPTPRWTTLERARHGVAVPEGIPATIQERAYTSPIWYEPHEASPASFGVSSTETE